MEDVKMAIMAIPPALSGAIQDWPAWIGFGALEGFGYYAQSMALDIWPVVPGVASSTNQMLRGFWAATIRGGLFASNLNYWNAYQGMSGGGGGGAGFDAGGVFNQIFGGVPIQRPQIG
jgi:hypothetical protein